MDMRVAGSLVMDGEVGAHPLVHKVVLHIGTHKSELLFAGQFARQSCFDLAGKLAVPCFLDLLHAVPEGGAVCKFRRGVGGQHDLRMDNAAFPGVVMGQAVPFICQLGSASVGGCGNSGTALAALDDTDGNMAKIYGWHLLSAGIFQAPWSRTNAKRVFGCAGRTRGLGSVAPHRGRSTQQPPAGRTAPATVYKCALVNKGLMACPGSADRKDGAVMLKIESIQNGIVIDHIPAGKGMDIYKLLELDSQKQSVALLQSVRSEKYGCKDLIKIEGLTEPERLEVLGYLNEGVTLIVIRDGKVVKKYHPVPPKTLKNVIKCKNPRCITSTEANCEHIFKLSSSGKYRCIYCNQEASLLR